MRLTHEQIEVIAFRVAADLRTAGLIQTADPAQVEARLVQVINDDLAIEDSLNEEVRELMRAYDEQIRRADVQYHEMFRAIKSRLARERNIIL